MMILEYLREKLTPASPNMWAGIAEAFLVPIILVAICYYFRPEDPFFIKGPFPWIFLAPVFITLRYGYWLGIIADIVVFAGIFYLEPHTLVSYTGYYYMLGFILVTYVSGEFHDTWRFRLIRAQQLNSYAHEHLADVTRDYYIW